MDNPPFNPSYGTKPGVRAPKNISDTSWDVFDWFDWVQSQYKSQITKNEKLLKYIQYLLDFPMENKFISCIILFLMFKLIGFSFVPWLFCLIFLMDTILIHGKDTLRSMNKKTEIKNKHISKKGHIRPFD